MVIADLLDDIPGNEETGDNKENIDADKPTWQKSFVEVEKNHGENSYRPEAINVGAISGRLIGQSLPCGVLTKDDNIASSKSSKDFSALMWLFRACFRHHGTNHRRKKS